MEESSRSEHEVEALEPEPGESVPRSFRLSVIESYCSEYLADISQRLGSSVASAATPEGLSSGSRHISLEVR